MILSAGCNAINLATSRILYHIQRALLRMITSETPNAFWLIVFDIINIAEQEAKEICGKEQPRWHRLQYASHKENKQTWHKKLNKPIPVLQMPAPVEPQAPEQYNIRDKCRYVCTAPTKQGNRHWIPTWRMRKLFKKRI